MALVDDLLAAWRENAERWESVRKPCEAAGVRVWNPGLYAYGTYERFLRRFPPQRGALLALGLNPGPAGMAQTGVPFTDCRTAKAKLGLDVTIPGCAPPDLDRLLQKAPGKYRLTYERSSLVVYAFLEHGWGDLRSAYANWYVGNPCPLLFLTPEGENVTPAHTGLRKVPGMRELRREAVERFARIVQPRGIVALGNDVAEAVGDLAEELVGPDRFVRVKHPAREPPARWGVEVGRELAARGLLRSG